MVILTIDTGALENNQWCFSNGKKGGARDVPARSTSVCLAVAGEKYGNDNAIERAAGRDVPRSAFLPTLS
jgi:hypothetical protein